MLKFFFGCFGPGGIDVRLVKLMQPVPVIELLKPLPEFIHKGQPGFAWGNYGGETSHLCTAILFEILGAMPPLKLVVALKKAWAARVPTRAAWWLEGTKVYNWALFESGYEPDNRPGRTRQSFPYSSEADDLLGGQQTPNQG